MNINTVKQFVVTALKQSANELQAFDELWFCKFSLTDLNLGKSKRFDTYTSIEHFKKYNLITTDLNEYLEFCAIAHESNGSVSYGCLGVVADTYFKVRFNFKVYGNGKIRKTKGGVEIRPHFNFSPNWVREAYIKSRGRLTVNDIVIKLKLENFLKDE